MASSPLRPVRRHDELLDVRVEFDGRGHDSGIAVGGMSVLDRYGVFWTLVSRAWTIGHTKRRLTACTEYTNAAPCVDIFAIPLGQGGKLAELSASTKGFGGRESLALPRWLFSIYSDKPPLPGACE